VKIYVVRVDPVQEVAAERTTLDRLTDLLMQQATGPESRPGLATQAGPFGLPLVYDDSIPPGFIYCRPTPGAPPPMSTEEIEQYLSAFMSRYRFDG